MAKGVYPKSEMPKGVAHTIPPVPVRPDDPVRSLARAERLLACYQQAVGHELPNQLVALQGTARMVAQDAGDRLDAETRAGLIRVAELARRVHDFVAVLADVGRTCRRVEPPQAVALEEVCREAAAEAGWLFPRPALRYDMLQPMPRVVLPPGAARRVFVELFLHAARRVMPEQAVRVEVSTVTTPAGTEVRVHDDGPSWGRFLTCLGEERQVRNLPHEEQAFDPFATPADQGPSFGLFLARQLVESWGGALRLASEGGTGCLAIVTIPGERPA